MRSRAAVFPQRPATFLPSRMQLLGGLGADQRKKVLRHVVLPCCFEAGVFLPPSPLPFFLLSPPSVPERPPASAVLLPVRGAPARGRVPLPGWQWGVPDRCLCSRARAEGRHGFFSLTLGDGLIMQFKAPSISSPSRRDEHFANVLKCQ